jgi:hypothetical protein
MPEQPDHDASYRDFLDSDRRRYGNALEFGHNWTDESGRRYRVCWYEETGELTAERLSDAEQLDVEDFYQGVAGPIEIIARISTRAQVDRLIGPWPHAVPGYPRTLACLRELANP